MTIDFQTLIAALVPTILSTLWVGSIKAIVNEHTRRLDILDNTVVKELARLREEFAELKGYLKATHKEN